MKRKNLAILILTIACVCFGVFGFAFTGAFAASEPKTVDQVSLNMKIGASVRKLDPTGLRFTSIMTADDYSSLTANVGDDKAYKSVTFGMLIAPEDYVTKYGELTEANVFGSDAKYSVSESDTEKPRIINVFSNEMSERDGVMCFAGVITNVKSVNYNRNFVGMGYIKAIDQNGNAVYKFATANDNTRSVITVAKAALNAGESDAAGVLGGFTKYANIAGIVSGVVNGDKTIMNAIDYETGEISITATAGDMNIYLKKEVFVENGAGCNFVRLYLKSSSGAETWILPRAQGSSDVTWNYCYCAIYSDGIHKDKNVYKYIDIPLNDPTVHDFSTYDLRIRAASEGNNITIEKIEFISLANSALKAESWDTYDGTTYTENDDGTFTARGWQFGLSASFIQSAIEAGYTHFKFDYTLENKTGEQSDTAIWMETQNGAFKYYRLYRGTSGTARFDLAKALNGSTYAKTWMQGRNTDNSSEIDVAMTIISATLIKSEETASWTKSSDNIYCAEEDGYIVLDTIACGNDANVLTSEDYCAKYFNNTKAKDGQNQYTVMFKGRYLYAGANTRGMVWGETSSAVSSVGGTANTDFAIEYANNRNSYAAGNKFYMGLDKEGVYQFAMSKYISSRNSWGGFSCTDFDANTYKGNMVAEQALVYAEKIEDLIAAGYTKVVITAEYTGGQLWTGSGYGTKWYYGLNNGETKEWDLSSFDTEACPYLIFYCSSAVSNATVTVRFF